MKPNILRGNVGLHFIQPNLRAKVVLADQWEERAKEDESGIPIGGCTYITKDPVLIASLVGLIRSNVEVVKHPASNWGGRTREFIYVALANGAKVEFRLAGAYVQEVDGYAIVYEPNGKKTELAVRAPLLLSGKLYKWAIKVEEKTPPEVRQQCEFAYQYQDDKK